MNANTSDWSDTTPQQRAAAFRAHHTGGMPYPNEVVTPDDLSTLDDQFGTPDQ